MTRLLIIFGFLAPSLLLGQYGNEWIDYSQKYYEIPIVETGVYRIDSTTLASVLAQTGDDLSAIDPRNLQLIGRDQELYIHVEGESDGVFNASDFLLFYAKKNDTWLDSNLFDNPDLLLNKEKSFTSDTIRYFLTWNNSINNRRVKQETDTDFSGYSSADYCWKTNKSTYHQEYFIGDQHEGLSRSKYEQAEGWAALRFAMGASHSAAISTANAYYGSGAPAANVEAVSAGASNASTSLSFNHKLIVSYTNASGSQIDVVDTTYFGYKVIRSLFTIPNSDIPATTSTIKHRSENLGQPSDYQTVGEVIVSYPHTFDFESTSWFDFSLEASIDPKQVLSITNFGASAPKLWLFSGDTIKDLAIVNSGASLDVLVPNNSAGTTQKLIMFDLNATRSVAASGSSGAVIRPVLGRGTFRDLAALNLDSAFIIVTHKSLMAEAKTYGAYRSSTAGGGFDTVVIDIDELYRQFGGGVVKSGIGIRRFCYYAIDNWPTQPSNLFLIGKSVMEASEGNAAVLSTVTWGIVEGLYDLSLIHI